MKICCYKSISMTSATIVRQFSNLLANGTCREAGQKAKNDPVEVSTKLRNLKFGT